MPVRSLNSSVLKWPHDDTVKRALKAWVEEAVKHHPELSRLGYFGSYARGDGGVGSDLDVVAVVRQTDQPPERRGLTWNTDALPVPVDLHIYTQREWERILQRHDRFARVMVQEVIWLK